MRIELDPGDLLPEYQVMAGGQSVDQSIPTASVTLDKLSDKAQAIVKLAGRAMYYAWDRQTYNAVYAPDEANSRSPSSRGMVHLVGNVQSEAGYQIATKLKAAGIEFNLAHSNDECEFELAILIITKEGLEARHWAVLSRCFGAKLLPVLSDGGHLPACFADLAFVDFDANPTFAIDQLLKAINKHQNQANKA